MPEAVATKGFESVNCMLCGTDNAESLVHKGQHELPAHVVLCRTCGLGYLNPRWTKDRYIEFYTNEYDKYYRSYLVSDARPAGTAATSAPAKVTVFMRMEQHGIMPASIRNFLDIGSGNGGFIRQARTRFPDASYSAIEPSANCAETLSKMDVKLLATDVDANWETGNNAAFDLVHMRHVLEHFSDPVAVLKKVHDVLTDDGLVYVAVPNSMNPSLPLCSFFFRVVHTYYFNAATLTETGRRAGLEPACVIDGDQYNRHEVVIIFRKGSKAPEFRNTWAEQREVFGKYIRHEMSWLYRFRQGLLKLTGRSKVMNGD